MDFFSSLSDKEEKAQLEAEKRQMDFAREQAAQQQAMDDNYHAATQNEKADLLKWQQDFEPDIDRLRHNLLGYVLKYNDGKRTWARKPNVIPLCNEIFFDQKIRPLCEFYLGKGQSNTNLTEHRICESLKRTMNTLAISIRVNHKAYGIQFEDAGDIMRQVKTVINGPAFRSIGGWLKRTDSMTIKRIEAFNEGPQEKKKSLLGSLGG